jgi:hypothetical protein
VPGPPVTAKHPGQRPVPGRPLSDIGAG